MSEQENSSKSEKYFCQFRNAIFTDSDVEKQLLTSKCYFASLEKICAKTHTLCEVIQSYELVHKTLQNQPISVAEFLDLVSKDNQKMYGSEPVNLVPQIQSLAKCTYSNVAPLSKDLQDMCSALIQIGQEKQKIWSNNPPLGQIIKGKNGKEFLIDTSGTLHSLDSDLPPNL